jgi:GAF domain-containing protein
VYRDKTLDKSLSDQQSSQAGKSSISLDLLKSSLNAVKGEKDILVTGLQAICKQLDAGQGAIYAALEEDGKRKIELKGGYALSIGESTIIRYEFGEGLIGQSAANGKTLYVDDVPEGYIRIVSGLGSASPKYLLIVPIKNQERVLAIMEIASFTTVTEDQRKFAEESANLISEKISGKA